MGAAAAKNVLVVEDDADIREALVGILRDEGYHVDEAANGAEALEHLRGGAITPGLILLDLMMPVINGWQFRAEQKVDPKFGHVPVVVISADGNVKQKAESIEAAAFLKKPIDLDVLLDLVAKFFAQPTAHPT